MYLYDSLYFFIKVPKNLACCTRAFDIPSLAKRAGLIYFIVSPFLFLYAHLVISHALRANGKKLEDQRRK